MQQPVARSARARVRIASPVVALIVALGLVYALPQAQAPAKKALTVEDYTKWRSITGQEISGDGKWVTYVLQITNTPPNETKPVLHLLKLETNEDVTVANATGGTFSPDSKWIAYTIDPNPGGRGRGGRGGGGGAATPSGDAAAGGAVQNAPGAQGGRAGAPPPPPQRVELRNLSTGAVQSWQDIQSFTFSPASTHVVLRRRPATTGAAAGRGAAAEGGGTPGGGAPGAAGGGAAASAPTAPRGVDVLLVDLRNGHHQLLGSVADTAFNKKGDLLAFTVDGSPKDANGLFVFDARSGRILALDSDAKNYNRLAWDDDGTALAVLKGSDVEKMRERENVVLAFPDVPAALSAANENPAAPVVLDAAKAEGFPKGWVISDRSPLTWSDDRTRVFFGAKEQGPSADTTRKTTDEAADVDVWNTGDERIQSVQMIRAEADRNFTFRQGFDVSAKRFVKLADETMRELDLAPDGRWAVGRDVRGHVHDYKRTAADIYRVNTTTGGRTLMLKSQLTNTSTGNHTFGISPDGRYFLYWKDDRYNVYDLDGAVSRVIGGAQAAAAVSGAKAAAAKSAASKSALSFVDKEFDHPGPRPSYGIAGYTSDGKSVIVQHRYDLWQLPLDGSEPKNLTNGAGAKNEIRFRYVRTQPADAPVGVFGGGPGGGRGGGRSPRETIDLSKPITLSAYGEWTKKAGFSELANGQLTEVVYEDASFSSPVRAKNADQFLFTRQTFAEFPDLRVSGASFKDSKKITDANPQQAEYTWGHRVLFDYKNKDGVRLQGILALPDDYKPGEKRPMLVTFYEKNSQNMHRYSPPSYLTGMGASPMQAVNNGYITMMPDIYFRTGASHSDMLECVEAATRKVIELGYADPKKIGVNGHSYGGEGAAFIGTRSRLFAAVAMGAGVTDLFTDFNQNWGWSYQVNSGSGENGHDYYLFNQGREGVSPWDNPEMYHFESALTHVPEVTAPFLIMHGTADPTVAFQNGLGFYNALRYNKKKAALLAYPGEGHGLRGMANRKDLTGRFFEFFDHYLKGAPEPKWWAEGVPYLKKDEKPAAKTPSGAVQ